MPFLPLQALRRTRLSTSEGDEGNGNETTTHRRTRRVVLEAAPDSPAHEDAAPKVVKSRTVGTPAVATPGRIASVRRMSAPTIASPHGAPAATITSSPVYRTTGTFQPAIRRITFAPSPMNTSAEITPYSRVYGVHPSFFDFDRSGHMAFTATGAYEYQRGSMIFTPTPKSQVAFVVAGSPTGSSPASSSAGSPLAASPWGFIPPPAEASGYVVGEQVNVATDDGKAWMDGVIVGAFPQDCEAEGYSIPAGTVKVQYQLGTKWVMPQNLEKTVRKKDVMAASSVYGFIPMQRPIVPQAQGQRV